MNTFELKLNMSSPLIEVGLDSWIILNREVAAVMDLDVTIDHQSSELQEFLNVIPELGPLNPPDLGNQMEIR